MLISVYCGLLNDLIDLSEADLFVATVYPTATRLKSESEEAFECFAGKEQMVFLRSKFLLTR
jgi:hypothetical protein